MGRSQGAEGADSPDYEPLIPGGSLFATARPRRDSFWAYLWALALAGVVVGAVYGGKNMNPDFGSLISPSYLADPSHCPADRADGGRRLLLADGEVAQPTFFFQAAGACTAVSIAGGLGLALLALYLFKRSPEGMVRASVALQVAIPASLALAAFLGGAPAAGLPFALLAAVLAITLYLYRSQLALVAKLLGISVRALADQPGIILAALGLQLFGLLLIAPTVAAMLLAFANGAVVPNPSRAGVDSGVCVDSAGREVVCCSWQVDGWVPGFMGYAGLVATWTTLLVFATKMFVIAGATAQWYFSPAGQGPPKGAVLLSARHALGPSFGSLCLASWLLTLISYARAALDKIRQDNQGNFCAVVLTACLDFLYAIFEAVTKFGVVRAAITGEAFMDACRGTVDLLARNMLDTVGVWWLPGLILQSTAFMLSSAWGLAAFWGASRWWGGSRAAVASGVALGVLAWLFAFIVLAFVNSVLLNMVDACYVSFAMDRDAAAVTRSDVHAVFSTPGAPWSKGPGAVVEQPDEGYAYAAPPSAPPAAAYAARV
ncbi:choline transporter-like [Raphidocelis subcapitata]|uniref:Choline transporter-like protein n=1 Tax=Raphidocelis subcapitata TaxID=307507 RepID=A0A2V0P2J9_9CHLO|nr:choline transporter-like [Raphidocelis subcapitata]|eukprot:GBF94104.1 choline transporter-like [Raphidocelis subcapitata]